MNIKIKGVDVETTDALQEYANKKVAEALEKFTSVVDSQNIFVEVELTKTNKHHNNGDMYEVTAKVNGLHRDIFARAVKDDLYAAIDELKDKLADRVSEIKDKKKTLRHKVALKFKNLFKMGE